MDAIIAQPVTPRKWYEIWWQVWRHPGAATFQDVMHGLGVGSRRGFKWVAVTAVIASLVHMVYTMLSPQSDLRMIISALIAIFIAPILIPIGVAAVAGLYHGIAKLFGGTGEWGEMVFCQAIVFAPSYLISTLSTSLITIAQSALLAQLFSEIIAFVLSIYVLVLNYNAIKAVENLSTGKSIGAYFLSTIIILLVGGTLISLLK